MSFYAHVLDDGTVRSIEERDGMPVTHPAIRWLECGPEVRPGWKHDGAAWVPPVVDEAAVTADLAQAMRQARDARLTACDWTQAPDAPLDDAQRGAWRTYRQALRDLTAQAGFPLDIAWPETPA